MKFSGEQDPKYIHPNYAVDPKAFRAQATGVGNTTQESRYTGARRAQRVADCMSAATRAQVPAAEGYPAPTPIDGAIHGYRY